MGRSGTSLRRSAIRADRLKGRAGTGAAVFRARPTRAATPGSWRARRRRRSRKRTGARVPSGEYSSASGHPCFRRMLVDESRAPGHGPDRNSDGPKGAAVPRPEGGSTVVARGRQPMTIELPYRHRKNTALASWSGQRHDPGHAWCVCTVTSKRGRNFRTGREVRVYPGKTVQRGQIWQRHGMLNSPSPGRICS